MSQKNKKRDNLVMLVEILCEGGRVTEDGVEYAMSLDGSLCMIAHTEDKEVPLKVDIDLSGLKSMADRIGSEKLWLSLCELSIP